MRSLTRREPRLDSALRTSCKNLRQLAGAARTRLGCSAQVTWNSNSQSLKYTLCRVTSPHRPEAETGIRGADKAHLTANDFVYSYFCAAGNKWLQSATCQLGRKQQFRIVGNGNTSSSAPPLCSQIFSPCWQRVSSLPQTDPDYPATLRVTGEDAKRGVVKSRVFLHTQLEERI